MDGPLSLYLILKMFILKLGHPLKVFESIQGGDSYSSSMALSNCTTLPACFIKQSTCDPGQSGTTNTPLAPSVSIFSNTLATSPTGGWKNPSS